MRAKRSKDRIAELLEEKCEVMIAPTIPYGATNTIYGCPGTITIGTDGLIMLLTKVCDCLYRYGFRKFIILNGHGSNCKAIEQVGMELHKKGAWLACLNWWLMAGELRPEWKGGHGGAEETAGIMGVDPSLVDMDYIHEPHLATEEWGKEMLQTMADYIADFIEEYEKIDLPHPAE